MPAPCISASIRRRCRPTAPRPPQARRSRARRRRRRLRRPARRSPPRRPARRPATAPATVSAALAASPRVIIDTPSVAGSIDLKGGKIDDLILKDYRETIDPKSPNIRLFSPPGAPDAYWAETGFVSSAGAKTPNLDTVWTADGKTLTPTQPVTLTWDNGAGLVFKRVIAVDDKYMFTITDSVVNSGAAPATVQPYGLILRHGRPNVAGYSVLHEGFEGVIGDKEHAADLRGNRQGHRQARGEQRRSAAGLASPTNIGARRSSPSRPPRSRPATRPPGPANWSTTRPISSARSRPSRQAPRPRPRPASSPAPRKSRRSTITRPRSASRNST